MKPFAIGLPLAALALGFAGCGGGEESKAPTTATAEIQPAQDRAEPPPLRALRTSESDFPIDAMVPETWVDDRSGEWARTFEGDSVVVGVFGASSPNIDGFLHGWTDPGVWVGASRTYGERISNAQIPELELPTVFAEVSPRDVLHGDCDGSVASSIIDRSSSDNQYSQSLQDWDFGIVDTYTGCGDEGATFLDIAAWSKNDRTFLYVQLQLVKPEDQAIVQPLLSSLKVHPELLPPP